MTFSFFCLKTGSTVFRTLWPRGSLGKPSTTNARSAPSFSHLNGSSRGILWSTQGCVPLYVLIANAPTHKLITLKFTLKSCTPQSLYPHWKKCEICCPMPIPLLPFTMPSLGRGPPKYLLLLRSSNLLTLIVDIASGPR